MPFPVNGTKLENLVNPQVMAGLINKKLVDRIAFSPLCRIDNTLEGRAGNTVTLPSFKYIGDAEDVAEGADIPIKKLTTATATVTVKKAGIGVTLTDESILSGYGDPLGEAATQIQKAIAAKVDKDVLAILAAIDAGMTFTSAKNDAFVVNDISDALVKFGEDLDGQKVMLISPEQLGKFRKSSEWLPASEIAASIILRGSVGMIYGCQIIPTNKLSQSKNAFIVKPGALALYMKREVMVERDRDIINKSTVITADKHYVAYMYDPTKAIKMKLAG